MRLFFKRNFDIVAVLVVLLFCIAATARDAFPQSSTSIQRKCTGASPNPAASKVDLEKDGDIQITPCSGRSIFVNATATSGLFASLNGLTATAQTFAAPTANDTASWSSVTATHTLRLPITAITGSSRTNYFPYFNAQNTFAKSPLSWDATTLRMDLSTADCLFCLTFTPSKLGGGSFVIGDLSTNYIQNSEASGVGIFRSAGTMTIWGGTSTTIKSTSGVTSLPDAVITFGGKTASGILSLNASNQLVSTALTNGQLLIGSTGTVPANATITAGTGIAVTNGAGSITIAADGASPLTTFLASDYTNATATFSSTALSLTLTAAKTYSFGCTIFASDSVAGEGFKIDLNGGTATATTFAAGTNSTLTTAVTTTLAGTFSNATITGTNMIQIYGTIVVNAGGTFILRGAQNSHSTGTVTFATGSRCQAVKLN